MKRVFLSWMIVYSLLGFGALSLPFSYLDKAHGEVFIDYGLPRPWLIVHQRLAEPDERLVSGEWWVTYAYSFSFPSLAGDIVVAVLGGVLLGGLTARVWHRIRTKREKHTAATADKR